jgi:branched-chain amino acid transport system permease protein
MIDWYTSNLLLIQATFTGLLLALSVQLPMRAGVFSFAGVGSYGIGSYLAAILVLQLNLGALEAIALATVAAGVVGLLLGILLQKLNGLYLAMATMAFCLVIGVLAINGGDLTGGSTGLFGVLTDFTSLQLYVIAIVGLVLVALTERGRTGRRIDAVREDPELAASMGINVRLYRVVVFGASAMLGGCAGAMNVLVRTTVSSLDIGFPLIVLALTMIIVGGTRSWKGAAMGAVIFTWLRYFLESTGPWQHIIYGIIIVAAAIYIPGGLHGMASDAWRRRKQRRRQPAPAEDITAEGAGAPDAELAAVGALPAHEPKGAQQ